MTDGEQSVLGIVVVEVERLNGAHADAGMPHKLDRGVSSSRELVDFEVVEDGVEFFEANWASLVISSSERSGRETRSWMPRSTAWISSHHLRNTRRVERLVFERDLFDPLLALHFVLLEGIVPRTYRDYGPGTPDAVISRTGV